MNVFLTPELEDFVNQKVKTGQYYSASEVIHEALWLLEGKDQTKEMRLERLRAEIQKGTDQIRSGNFIEINTKEDLGQWAEKIKQEGRRRLEQRRNESE